MKKVILGTAGHIDHGKSSVVKALTGIDPDRLKEEKERGITIDLGFANIVYPDVVVGIVDVPGHERLIKNMLAGVGGMDMVMLVVAADEGVMPQTKEHLAICNLLKIKSGIIALNKADLVDEETLELAKEDVKEAVKGTFLENAEIVAVSAKTGLNIEVLKGKIRELALKVSEKSTGGIFRMPIDRVFTLKGFGTVVTGTVLSGAITIDSPVEILPAGITSKVRGLQSHGQALKEVYAGQRVGINLQGVSKEDIKRGDIVTVPGKLKPSSFIEVKLELLKDVKPLKHGIPVHFYLTTSETVGKLKLFNKTEVLPDEEAYAHIKLQDPIVAMAGDRFILRRFSPLETLGGGIVIDPEPPRKKKDITPEHLEILFSGALYEKLEVKIKRRAFNGISISELEGWINSDIIQIKTAVDELIKKRRIINAENHLFHIDIFNEFKSSLLNLLKEFHATNPFKEGLPKEELKVKLSLDRFPKVLMLLPYIEDVSIQGNTVKLKSVSKEKIDPLLEEKIIKELQKEFQPPFKDELAQTLSISESKLTDILKIIAKQGKIVRINDSLYLTIENYNKMINLLKDFFSKKNEMTVSEFRTLLNTTRKYAIAYLEHLDSQKITLRVGEIRKMVKRG
ncbi:MULTISPECIES: selenocysteine-specific translation elongation factor [Thermodesulfovibrio]|jgi:selenocysteine-specific elongation factor|uniref:Selenocysteine-specific elongation factor n=2 Tax=Thermodesulfovibrio yellowstonii TaxID=28262 RepID=B5YHA3_THEYD|nr:MULTISPECIES: selenocysteine-specific translation elongation factor [Thermodesulfovibrio]ACI21325.1 selenocysteine-specific translation elongation factor [Thermodesulfovibrio yellowstonii DSM 11347]GLI52605.1 selenocysteine-specific translation factor [Thermodesulfovibrio islandicus]